MSESKSKQTSELVTDECDIAADSAKEVSAACRTMCRYILQALMSNLWVAAV